MPTPSRLPRSTRTIVATGLVLLAALAGATWADGPGAPVPVPAPAGQAAGENETKPDDNETQPPGGNSTQPPGNGTQPPRNETQSSLDLRPENASAVVFPGGRASIKFEVENLASHPQDVRLLLASQTVGWNASLSAREMRLPAGWVGVFFLEVEAPLLPFPPSGEFSVGAIVADDDRDYDKAHASVRYFV